MQAKESEFKDIDDKQSIKLTDQQKLSIIDEILLQIQPQYPLQVSRTSETLNQLQINNSNNHQTNPSYFYTVLGQNKLNKRTQNSNLIQKIGDLEKQQQSQLQIKQNINEEFGNKFRYYNDNIRCFRCRRSGHYVSACPEQFSCVYCLSSQHNYEKCPQKIVCYRCYNFGHMVNDCPRPTQGPYCNSCKRKHFQACYFLTKGIEQVKQMFNTEMLYYSEQIRCMVCLKYGHVACQSDRYELQYENEDNRNQQQFDA